jgi:hypothetical protein
MRAVEVLWKDCCVWRKATYWSRSACGHRCHKGHPWGGKPLLGLKGLQDRVAIPLEALEPFLTCTARAQQAVCTLTLPAWYRSSRTP